MLGKSLFKSSILIIFVSLFFGFVFVSCGGGGEWTRSILGVGDDNGNGVIALPSNI